MGRTLPIRATSIHNMTTSVHATSATNGASNGLYCIFPSPCWSEGKVRQKDGLLKRHEAAVLFSRFVEQHQGQGSTADQDEE